MLAVSTYSSSDLNILLSYLLTSAPSLSTVRPLPGQLHLLLLHLCTCPLFPLSSGFPNKHPGRCCSSLHIYIITINNGDPQVTEGWGKMRQKKWETESEHLMNGRFIRSTFQAPGHSLRLCPPGNTPTFPPYILTPAHTHLHRSCPPPLFPGFFLLLSSLMPSRQHSALPQSNCRTEQALFCVHFYLRPPPSWDHPFPVCLIAISQGFSRNHCDIMFSNYLV